MLQVLSLSECSLSSRGTTEQVEQQTGQAFPFCPTVMPWNESMAAGSIDTACRQSGPGKKRAANHSRDASEGSPPLGIEPEGGGKSDRQSDSVLPGSARKYRLSGLESPHKPEYRAFIKLLSCESIPYGIDSKAISMPSEGATGGNRRPAPVYRETGVTVEVIER